MEEKELKKLKTSAEKISNHISWEEIEDKLYVKGKYISELIVDIINLYLELSKGKKIFEKQNIKIKLIPFGDYPKYESKGPSLYAKEHFLMDMDEKNIINNLELDILEKFDDDTSTTASYEYYCAKFILLPKTFDYLKETIEKIQATLTKSVSFDEEKSVLIIGKNEIEIRKNSNQFYILKAIFESNLDDNIQFDELGEKIDYEKNEEKTDKYWYNHIDPIKKKIFAQTGIDDFFITQTHSVQINPKYII